MSVSKRFSGISVIIASFLSLNACSADDKRDDGAAGKNNLADTTTSEVALSSTVDETLDSLSDSNFSSNDAGLSLLGDEGPESTVERSCVASDSKAVVTINRTKTRDTAWETRRFSFENSASSKALVTRTWMKDGATVACAPNGKHAAIAFEADLSGYKLDITIDRTASRESSRTSLKTNASSKFSANSSVKGSRHVEWLSQAAGDDGSLTRTKTISFSTQRTSKATLKDGTVKNLDLTLATVEGSPLKVSVTWSAPASSRVLASKLIESGKIKASEVGSGSIETSFSQVLMKFTDSTCQLESGTIEAKVFAEGATTASKTYQLTAEAGDVTMTDITDPAAPKEVDDFEYSPCDLKDFNF